MPCASYIISLTLWRRCLCLTSAKQQRQRHTHGANMCVHKYTQAASVRAVCLQCEYVPSSGKRLTENSVRLAHGSSTFGVCARIRLSVGSIAVDILEHPTRPFRMCIAYRLIDKHWLACGLLAVSSHDRARFQASTVTYTHKFRHFVKELAAAAARVTQFEFSAFRVCI